MRDITLHKHKQVAGFNKEVAKRPSIKEMDRRMKKKGTGNASPFHSFDRIFFFVFSLSD
jgi:hypothetical protein